LASPLFTATGLFCERDFRVLFDQLDVELHAGEVLQIKGQNGVGKTSLLRGLYGLNADVKGDFAWFGQAWPQARFELYNRSLFLGHQTGVKASMTGRENLQWFFGLRQTVTLEQMTQALAAVDLAGYEDSYCYSLSAGQQRRVALARLFISHADVWLLDEPFTAIDADGVLQLERLIQRFAEQGGAVMLTSHHTLTQIPVLRTLDLEAYRA